MRHWLLPQTGKLLQTSVLTDVSSCTKAIKESRWGFGHRNSPTCRQTDRVVEAVMARTVLNPLIYLNYCVLNQLFFPDLTVQIAEVKAKNSPVTL